MGAVAHYGPPVAMQPCYLGADGPLPMPPLQHPCARTQLPAKSSAHFQNLATVLMRLVFLIEAIGIQDQ